MMLKSSLFLASLPAVAFAACFDVDVGNGGLIFKPNTLTAAVGDTVNFHFYPGDHGVASGSFSSACTPAGDMWSGFINPSQGEASMMYSITVSSTDPLFLYCPQVGHCKSGMVMAINPSSSESFAAYQKAALASGAAKTPSAVGGGMLIANADCSAGGASSSAAPSSAAASSSAAATSKAAASSSAAAMSSAGSSSAAAATSASPVPTPGSPAAATSASPYPTPGPSSAAPVSQISDGQPQVSSPGAPVYTGAANSMNGAAAAVAAAAGIVGMAMI